MLEAEAGIAETNKAKLIIIKVKIFFILSSNLITCAAQAKINRLEAWI